MALLEALATYGTAILLGVASAVLCSFLFSMGLHRMYRRLNLRLIDLENAHVQLRNKGYANKRWQNAEQLEAEMAQMGLDKPAAKRQKFDNDPLDF